MSIRPNYNISSSRIFLVDCWHHRNGVVPWFWACPPGSWPLGCLTGVHTGWDCGLFVSLSYSTMSHTSHSSSARSLCAIGEMTTHAPISGTFPHFGQALPRTDIITLILFALSWSMGRPCPWLCRRMGALNSSRPSCQVNLTHIYI